MTVVDMSTPSSFHQFVEYLFHHGFYTEVRRPSADYSLICHDVADHLVAPPNPLHPVYIPPTPEGEFFANINRVARHTPEAITCNRFQLEIQSLHRLMWKEYRYKMPPDARLPDYNFYLKCHDMWHGRQQNALTRGLLLSKI